MRFRWTMKQLKEVSDLEFLRILCVERKSDCTNIYSLLHKKVSEIEQRLEDKIAQDEKEDEKEEEDTNKHVTILLHDISYFFAETDLDIDGCGIEHIEYEIGAGIREGSVNVTDPDTGEDNYGYWKIVK